MFTILKPFLKYDTILALFLVVYNLLAEFAPDPQGINYALLVYFPILLLTAPIVFGIWYGYHVSRNYILSLKRILGISFIIFTLNCITYLIPYWEWLVERSIKLFVLPYFTLPPSTFLTLSFLCSVIFNNKKQGLNQT